MAESPRMAVTSGGEGAPNRTEAGGDAFGAQPRSAVGAAGFGEPLTPDERAEAEQLARRLHAELAGMLALLPSAERGASAIARTLGLDRATCQRIVATAAAEPTPHSLVHLPGVQGLRQFLGAMQRSPLVRHADEQLAAASAAIDRYEELVDRLAGSQRRLKARLAADMPVFDAAGPGRLAVDDVHVREALFKAAAAAVGRWSSVAIDLRIVTPVPGDPSRTDGARLRGVIGHVSRADAVPLEVGETSSVRALDGHTPAFATLDERPASGETPGALLLPFCSHPLPRVLSRTATNLGAHVLDTAESGGKPSDIVLGLRNAAPDAHPATLNPPIGEMWWLVSYPTRRLIFDVWLHKDIAAAAQPSLEVHLWGPDVGRHRRARWSTRFPGGPRLALLGPGLANAGSTGWERHQDATTHLFDRMGLNAHDFIGYRCDVAYPVWRAGYVMSFDFSPPTVEHEA